MSNAVLMEALVAYLKANTPVSTLVSTRVYGLEFPKEQVAAMPQKAVLLSLTPAIGGLTEQTDIEHEMIGLDVFNYGETPLEALKVHRATYRALKGIHNVEQLQSIIHWANRSVGPRSFMDPDLRAPVVVETVAVFGSEYTTA